MGEFLSSIEMNSGDIRMCIGCTGVLRNSEGISRRNLSTEAGLYRCRRRGEAPSPVARAVEGAAPGRDGEPVRRGGVRALRASDPPVSPPVGGERSDEDFSVEELYNLYPRCRFKIDSILRQKRARVRAAAPMLAFVSAAVLAAACGGRASGDRRRRHTASSRTPCPSRPDRHRRLRHPREANRGRTGGSAKTPRPWPRSRPICGASGSASSATPRPGKPACRTLPA